MKRSIVAHTAAVTLPALLWLSPVWAQQTAAADASLDSLLNTHVSAASKYDQTMREAPASVTILTSDDIRRSGFRNLEEALESVRGFYMSNDHNYPYLGTRGFSRPTDYNNRILLLIDGHTLNEQTWGAAPVGSDLPINLRAVERIEVVRGPGSVLYGTSAMFAVVNIVTKTGLQLEGVQIGGSAGTLGSRELSFAAGNTLGTRGSFALSGIVNRADGRDFVFPELNAPETNFGVSRGMDGESSMGGLARLTVGAISGSVGFRTRTKGIPTGAYGISLNDPRAETMDQTLWGEISAKHDAHGLYRVAGRLYADRYLYRGAYPVAPGPSFTDGGGSAAIGGEAILVWDPVSRLRVTAGSEVRHVLRADYYTDDHVGGRTADNAPFKLSSVFAQSELQLFSNISLVGGARYDRQSSSRHALTPRLALVATPDARTTLKLLYGEAFRAPSAAESDISSGFYSENPDLRPERVRTFEVELQRRLGDPLMLELSLYNYSIANLIDQVEITRPGGLQYLNIATAEGVGAELQADFRPRGPFAAHAWYTLQRAEQEPGNLRLTNAPLHTGMLSVSARTTAGWSAVIAERAESERLTLKGAMTPAFVRTDLNIGFSPTTADAPGWLRRGEISVRATNLFNTQYYAPGGVEHVQAAIPQDRRIVSLRVDWRF